jgi:hypothetical protein
MNGLGYNGMAKKSRRGTQKARTSALPTPGVQQKMWDTLSPRGEGKKHMILVAGRKAALRYPL